MAILDRRDVLSGMGAALMTSPASQLAAEPSQWQGVAPADAGFSPDLEARLDRLIADKRAWNLHGVVVVRNDRLVLECYFEGEDHVRGIGAIGRVAFKPDTLHDMRSVSKSIVGLLYGIALQQGKVPPPEAPLFASFPEHADLAAEAGRERLTIHHALTMTMGTEWDEMSVPYTNPANSETAMDGAANRSRYILERRVIEEPGRCWIYNGGATALLARIIADSTGKPLHDFAREALFDPLGLGPTAWAVDTKGEAYAASGLRMTPRDLARIGVMMVGGGVAGDHRVVPAPWIARSTQPVVSTPDFWRFGYHWYVGDAPFGSRVARCWGAFGNGGQRLWVLPTLGIAVAVTAGNYNTRDQWLPPTRVLYDAVLTSLV
jgi:CubicO group peptidase (beta-lactamase class C family)